MSDKPGEFIWYELNTPDPDGAAAFYKDVIGLTAADSGMEGPTYWLMSAPGGEGIGGMMELTAEMKEHGARAAWHGYIEVSDVDATLEAAQSKGATVHVPATDIPNVGRFAMMGDPHGAPIYIMHGTSDDDSTSFSAERKVGHVGWNELMAGDLDQALDFYSSFTGWTKGEAMDTPQGPYQMYGLGETMLGGMMKAADEMPPMWNYYFWVDSVESAVERINAAGGNIFHGPQEIPGGDVIVFATDPQGAMFCLVGPR